MTKEKIEFDAAIKIQSAFKGYSTRKAYALKQLSSEDMVSYRVLIAGNDPVIEGLPTHNKNESIALLGTSGLRSV
jgi:hypothetical protein